MFNHCMSYILTYRPNSSHRLCIRGLFELRDIAVSRLTSDITASMYMLRCCYFLDNSLWQVYTSTPAVLNPYGITIHYWLRYDTAIPQKNILPYSHIHMKIHTWTIFWEWIIIWSMIQLLCVFLYHLCICVMAYYLVSRTKIIHSWSIRT